MNENVNPLTGCPVSNEEMEQIAQLARQAKALAAEIDNLEIQVGNKKMELQKLTDNFIPDAMNAIGMSEFKLNDGTGVTVKPYYSAKIPDALKLQAFKWLEDHEHDSIIKAEVSVAFGKGERSGAQAVEELLRRNGFNPERSEGVHPQTLKAFVKEQIEGGNALPFDLFGVYVGKRAKFTEPKK